MKRNIKVLCLVTLLALLIVLCCTATVFADEIASGFCGYEDEGGPAWTLSDQGVLTISGTGDIPSYEGQDVPPWYTYCEDIKSIVIEDGVNQIGVYAFYGCINLTSIYIPSSVTNIAEFALFDCNSLKDITIDELNTELCSVEGIVYSKNLDTLYCCAPGKSGEIIVPDSVKTIQYGAFASCSLITSVVLPDGLIDVESYAFYGTSITEITIPASVETLHFGTFEGCNRLENIYVDENSELFSSIDGILYGKDKKYLHCCPEGKKGIITIGKDTSIINKYAFFDCNNIKEIILEDGSEAFTILEDAFYGIENDLALTIPATCSDLNIEGTIPENIIIKGYDNTEAYFYAKEKGIKFVSLGANNAAWSDINIHSQIAFEKVLESIRSKYNGNYKKTIPSSTNNSSYITVSENNGSLVFKYVQNFNYYLKEVQSIEFTLSRKGELGPIRFADSYTEISNGTASGYLYASANSFSSNSSSYNYSFSISRGSGYRLSVADANDAANTALKSALMNFDIYLPTDLGARLYDIYFRNYGNWNDMHFKDIKDKISPTCTEKGYTGTEYCMICGAVISEPQEIPALGHDYQVTDFSPATCMEEGYYNYKCSRCGQIKEEVAPITDHEYGDWEEWVDPTCTEDGRGTSYCYYCGKEETEIIPKTGHKWDSRIVTIEPTTEKDGERIYTCTVCGEKKIEVIPKLDGGETAVDPATEMGSDGTPFGEGASIEAVDETITSKVIDNTDPKGTVFGLLKLKQAKVTKTSIKISWSKITGAKKYVIYANSCGKTTKLKKVKTTTGTSRLFTKMNGKKMKKGTYYKFLVVALDKNNKVISTSKMAHIATTGGKYTNAKAVTTKAKNDRVTLKVKKTFKLSAKVTMVSPKLKTRVHRKTVYESSNTKIATVSKKGIITAKKKGTCYVYAYAQNGIYKRIKVTVK